MFKKLSQILRHKFRRLVKTTTYCSSPLALLGLRSKAKTLIPPALDPPPTLPSSVQEARNSASKDDFLAIKTFGQLAEFLGTNKAALAYTLWHQPLIGKYVQFEIPQKRGGTRLIFAPKRKVECLQYQIKEVLDQIYRPRAGTQAFVKGRSIVSNARVHCKQYYVLNLDLEDFFPSITFARVRGMFQSKPFSFNAEVATALAQLVCAGGSLPVGAPTSPIISNIICRRLDRELYELCSKLGCKCTRYADDITISTFKRQMPAEIVLEQEDGVLQLGSQLLEILQGNGFTQNVDKTYLRSRNQRQEVTGLTVNRRPRTSKRYIANLRAMLYAWKEHGLVAAEADFCGKFDRLGRQPAGGSLFRRVVQGKLAFLKQVRGADDRVFVKYYRLYCELDNRQVPAAMLGVRMDFDVFIIHASEDKSAVVQPLQRALELAGLKVWVDSDQIGWGDPLLTKIQKGLSRSTFCIAVISDSMLKKNWPMRELDAMMSREVSTGRVIVLPLLHGDKKTERLFQEELPLVSAKLYEKWDAGDVGHLVSKVKAGLS